MAPVIMGNADRPELAEELRASFCRTDVEVARTFARATFLADNRADLARVTVPTLVLQAADDSIAPEVVGRFVQARIPDSELTLLAATGHCPNLSAPDETAAAIRRYLGAHGAAERRRDRGRSATGPSPSGGSWRRAGWSSSISAVWWWRPMPGSWLGWVAGPRRSSAGWPSRSC